MPRSPDGAFSLSRPASGWAHRHRSRPDALGTLKIAPARSNATLSIGASVMARARWFTPRLQRVCSKLILTAEGEMEHSAATWRLARLAHSFHKVCCSREVRRRQLACQRFARYYTAGRISVATLYVLAAVVTEIAS